MAIIHTSAYKFISLEQLQPLQGQLFHLCESLQLKGTILISHEGINIAMAGEEDALKQFKEGLVTIHSGFANLFYKDTICHFLPFKKLKVKIKQEVISIGDSELSYIHNPKRTLTPEQLKQWYESGLEFDIIDTRNDYEYHIGSFEKATLLPLKHFRNFGKIVSEELQELKHNGKPKVIFCTGGIRCEKALPVMEKLGFENVFQLEGGIIHYFQKCGGAHYEGECYVFDDRIALDSLLNQTETTLCEHCQLPLTAQQKQENQHQCETE